MAHRRQQRRAAARAEGLGQGASGGRGRSRCSSWSSCPSSPTTARGSCRAACSSAWPSPGPWRPHPALLLMDEPFGALDEMTREHMQAELLRICARDRDDRRLRHPLDPRGGVPVDRVVVMSPRPGRITDRDRRRPRRARPRTPARRRSSSRRSPRCARRCAASSTAADDDRSAVEDAVSRVTEGRIVPVAPGRRRVRASRFLALWELVVMVLDIKPYLLPKPSAIWHEFARQHRADLQGRAGHGHERPGRAASSAPRSASRWRS